MAGRDPRAGSADHSSGGFHGVARNGTDCTAAGREAAAAGGTSTSSMRRRITSVSPFSVGRGPRTDSDTTFQGHSGGIIHSMASRLGSHKRAKDAAGHRI